LLELSGQFFDAHLKLILMNEKSVNWLERDNRNLLKSNYDAHFLNEAYNKTVELTFDKLTKLIDESENTDKSIKDLSFLLAYKTKEEFLKYANYFKMMNDFKVYLKEFKTFFFWQSLVY
jgi:hypothetical protein